jgi:hypothetical protein
LTTTKGGVTVGCCKKPKETKEPQKQDTCCEKKDEPKKKDPCCGGSGGKDKE